LCVCHHGSSRRPRATFRLLPRTRQQVHAEFIPQADNLVAAEQIERFDPLADVDSSVGCPIVELAHRSHLSGHGGEGYAGGTKVGAAVEVRPVYSQPVGSDREDEIIALRQSDDLGREWTDFLPHAAASRVSQRCKHVHLQTPICRYN
jgi:hypothetical protein